MPSDHEKLFLIALRCGRLANRLVLYANFIGLAEERGYRLINSTLHSYADLFESTRRDIYCQYPAPRRRSWLDIVPGLAPAIRKTRILYHLTRAASGLNERLRLAPKSVVTLREIPDQEVTPLASLDIETQIRGARLVFVYGWRFRAPALVEKHAAKIRAYFQPAAEHEEASRQAVERLRRDADIVAGVHIRHGDYEGWKGGEAFFPASRYAAWMQELEGKFPGSRVAFLVCSDAPRQLSEFPGLTVGFGPGTPVGDLFALAKCDYIMGPRSTFSQWASFYGNKPLFQLRDAKASLDHAQFGVSWLAEIP